ncbi:MAG: EamA family transporter [Candidatus Rokubacteria bacterium]|nr:EamA family transporter [Candidatus Rokubacteria bacterium]MBI2526518.1 EamA family transporter [Candidatus Rokubacteria bacterium]
MPASALALVLAAALFHAGWNALTKRARDQLAFLWSSLSLATVLLAPFGIAYLPDAGVPAAALPYLVTTSVVHAAYFFALGKAYATGELSLVYPIARGLGVALVPVGALLVLEERLSPLGAAGIALVVLGIVTITAGPAAAGGAARVRRHLGAGAGWALVTGVTIASYSLVDKAGVARLHPVPYLAVMGVAMSLLLAVPVLARRGALRREWQLNWRTILIASTMNLTSYLLVLFAFTLSKAGYVVASREISIVLSVLIGRLWLGERQLGRRLVGAAVVVVGVICVALAR